LVKKTAKDKKKQGQQSHSFPAKENLHFSYNLPEVRQFYCKNL